MNIERLKRFAIPSVVLPALAVAGGLGISKVRERVIEDERSNAIVMDSVGLHENMDYGYAPNNNDFSEIISLQEDHGLPIHTVNYFIGDLISTQDTIDQYIHQACEAGMTPMLSWGQFKYIENPSDVEIDELRQVARHWASMGCEIEFRPYYEMNGAWFADIPPDMFIAGWRRMYEIFQEEGAVNVKFVWSPNSTVTIQSFEKYFPGIVYVDKLAIDIYNKSHSYILDLLSQLAFPDISVEATLIPDLQILNRLAEGKEVFIAELGCAVDQQWCIDMIELARRYGIKRIVFFGWQKDGVALGEYDWDIRERRLLLNYMKQILIVQFPNH